VILEANLQQLQDPHFVYDKILCGDPESKLFGVRKEALLLRCKMEDCEIARLQRETVEKGNKMLGMYTFLTGVIAAATIANVLIELWRLWR